MLRKILLASLLAFTLAACGQSIDSDEGEASAEEGSEEIGAQAVENDQPELDETSDDNKEKESDENSNDNSNEETKTNDNERSNTNNLPELKAHFIDVGQADATLFQYTDEGKTYNVLYDTGDWNKNDVVQYLTAHDITTLDLVIVSHPHADHIGQMADIVEKFTVEEVWFSGNTASSKTFQRAAEAVLASDATYYEPRAGDIFDVGSLTLEVLHPSRLTGGLNEDSISIRFSYGDVAFLLTGDAYKQNELEMMKRASTVKSQILQLGHHGSKTSSDPAFIKAVNPSVAIYSASANNSYGHPSPEVVSLIQDEGIDLYGTDVHGTIIVTTDGSTYNVLTKKDGTISPKSTGSSNKSSKKGNGGKGSSNKKSEEKSNKGNSSSSSSKSEAPAGNCVDINSASVDEVQKIIHIGPARAEDLVELRPFQSVDDLTRISGIGPARIKDIKEQGVACVGGG